MNLSAISNEELLEEDLFERAMKVHKGNSFEPFATFDFDGSIIYNDSAEAVLAYMARHDISTAREDLKRYYSLLDSGDTRAAYRFGALTLCGLSSGEIHRIVQAAMAEEGTEITKAELFGRTISKGIAPRANVVALMRRFQLSGVRVWVVSASPWLVVHSAMEYFGIDADLIGIRNIISDGVVTAELQEPLPIYEGKVACIKELISESERPILALGNSMNDLPMLEYSRLQAVVDRGNDLGVKAKERGWFLL
jgi:HAD superfamily phosphoserine phosphatase-like hydrolase